MGFNSTLVILNDRLDEIENDPYFGKKVADAIRAHYSGREPYITGQTKLVDVTHADNMQILAVGGNTGRVIGYDHYRATDSEIVKNLNRERLRLAKET